MSIGRTCFRPGIACGIFEARHSRESRNGIPIILLLLLCVGDGDLILFLGLLPGCAPCAICPDTCAATPEGKSIATVRGCYGIRAALRILKLSGRRIGCAEVRMAVRVAGVKPVGFLMMFSRFPLRLELSEPLALIVPAEGSRKAPLQKIAESRLRGFICFRGLISG